MLADVALFYEADAAMCRDHANGIGRGSSTEAAIRGRASAKLPRLGPSDWRWPAARCAHA
jgi:hypothetical protein